MTTMRLNFQQPFHLQLYLSLISHIPSGLSKREGGLSGPNVTESEYWFDTVTLHVIMPTIVALWVQIDEELSAILDCVTKLSKHGAPSNRYESDRYCSRLPSSIVVNCAGTCSSGLRYICTIRLEWRGFINLVQRAEGRNRQTEDSA